MKSTNQSIVGTSFFSITFVATPKQLREILGKPEYECNDGKDKVQMEWYMETEGGEVFTVYDWKEYRPLKENEKIEWHIGGFHGGATIRALQEIKEYL